MFAHQFYIIILVFALKVHLNDATLAPQWQLTSSHYKNTTIEEAIKQYFEQKTNVLHVRVHLRSLGPWRYVILQHLKDVLRNSTRLTFRITIEDQLLRSNKYYLYNLWYVDSYEALNDILPYKRKHFGSSPGYYAIFLATTKYHRNVNSDIQKILEKMFSLQIIDVIVITYNVRSLLVYSYDPFNEKTCRLVIPKVINTFKAGRFNDSELFHNKLKKFHNCTIRVKSRNVPPYFTYHKKNTNGSSIVMKGIEAELLKIIAKQLEFHIELQMEWPTHRNGTRPTTYDLLQNNEVDVLMGYFFYSAYNMPLFEESLSYFTSPLAVYVKRHISKSNIMWIIEPFQFNTWLALLTMTATVIILLYFAGLRHHCGNWLDIIGSILGEPRVISTRNDLARFSITLWCGSFVILSSLYQAKLFDSYNQPPTQIPHTLKSLEDNNFTFYLARGMSLKYWLPELNFPKNRIRQFDTLSANLFFEKFLNASGNVAILTTVAQIQHFEHSQQLSSNVFDQVPEIVQTPEFCAYFRHHSFLVKPFNDVISRIRASGLIARWLRNDFTEPSVRMRKSQNDSNPKRLDVEKFLMVLFLFVCGQLLAIIVFIIECVSGHGTRIFMKK